ncbi:nacht nucleoside triphosphatase [Podospora aff. communis PSN243]|uniref:Nacht nucleoside triphosphatase n=1 Tax=Podospora aff. communis PSN243 TaxID=3040156 RepID=A0AAV9GSD6_9PEZI|nr:nacht nucleoside triphosphatase [Podospora aff. communis PSN243]
MEALAALGVAASAVQFATFASNLISSAAEIHGSASGTTEHALSMETVYSQLSELASALSAATTSDCLSAASRPPPPDQQSNASAANLKTIQVLSQQCGQDCRRLLGVVAKLKSQPGAGSRRRWESFRIALRSLWKRKDIQDLEYRLSNTQTTLILCVVKLTADWHASHQEQLECLRNDSLLLRSDHHARLEDIAKDLSLIGKDVSFLRKSIESGTRLDALRRKMVRVEECSDDVARQQAILQSLTFPARPVRHESLSQAHNKTYQWVFAEPGTEARRWSQGKFLRWLQDGRGIFWVSGKAGSGKSTLVKFVADDRRTLAALRHWAGPTDVVIVSHYFWAAGSAMQRSQQGLLQTLLFEIFRQFPGLTKSACPNRCTGALDSLPSTWCIPELHDALRRVAEVPMSESGASRPDPSRPSFKFCVFIDGADEYDGDHLELCDAIKELSHSAHFKFCISSRPWNVFEDAFGGDEAQKISLHELTREDIRRYAESRLQQHPRWNRIESSGMAEECQRLLDQITERSSGVFLWVVLVANLLREGLTNDDSLSDLRKRLESFPIELEEFFRSMLDSVEPFYREKMATTLRIATYAKEPLHWTLYRFHDMEYEDLEYALHLPPESIPETTVKEMEARTTRRLNGRTRGLLEVNASGEVNVLHRTVMDFLKTREMADFLVHSSPSWFMPECSVLKAYTTALRVQSWPGSISLTKSGPAHYRPAAESLSISSAFSNKSFVLFIRNILLTARELENHPDITPPTHHALLDEVDAILGRLSQDGAPLVFRNTAGGEFFREMVVDAELVGYLDKKLTGDPHYLDCLFTPRILFLLMAFQGYEAQSELPRYSPRPNIFCMAQIAMKSNVCREELSSDAIVQGELGTSWELFVSHAFKDEALFSSVLNSGAIPLLLKHGANPQARWDLGPCHVWEMFLDGAFSHRLKPPDHHAYLQTLSAFIATGKLPAPKEMGERTKEFFDKLIGRPCVGKASLLEGVLDRLLPLLHPLGGQDGHIWTAIKEGLPPDIVAGLISRHGEGEEDSEWMEVILLPGEGKADASQGDSILGSSLQPLVASFSSKITLAKRLAGL